MPGTKNELVCRGIKSLNNAALFWSSKADGQEFYKASNLFASGKMEKEAYKQSMTGLLNKPGNTGLYLQPGDCFLAILVGKDSIGDREAGPDGAKNIAPQVLHIAIGSFQAPGSDTYWIPAGMCQVPKKKVSKDCKKPVNMAIMLAKPGSGKNDTEISSKAKPDLESENSLGAQQTKSLYQFEMQCNRAVRENNNLNLNLVANQCLNAAILYKTGIDRALEPDFKKARLYVERACYFQSFGSACKRGKKMLNEVLTEKRKP
jgi:hypothetical protein